MRADFIDLKSPTRKLQLSQINSVLKNLITRECKCGCLMKFKVLPHSYHFYASLGCASKAGWKIVNKFGPQGDFQMDRRWLLYKVPGIDSLPN